MTRVKKFRPPYPPEGVISILGSHVLCSCGYDDRFVNSDRLADGHNARKHDNGFRIVHEYKARPEHA